MLSTLRKRGAQVMFVTPVDPSTGAQSFLPRRGLSLLQVSGYPHLRDGAPIISEVVETPL